jgi:5-methylcytosine-specific restriction endonuclease McrA
VEAVSVKPGIRQRERNRKLRASVGQCEWCGRSEDLTVDHIVPQAHGGTWALENLRVLCAGCNQFRSNAPERWRWFE